MRDWRITGIDVDYAAIRDAGRTNAGPNVDFVAGDAKDADVLPPDTFDVVYMHGIFDQCVNHRAVLENGFRSLRPGGKLFYVAPDRNLYTWLSFITVGPLLVFKLRETNHDFRRFPRPKELDRLLSNIGFNVEPDPQHPEQGHHLGLEYTTRMNPLGIANAVRRRDLRPIQFEFTKARWWLGNGFMGEYLGVAEKPATKSAAGRFQNV